MPLLTRTGGAATKTNLVADIKTAFAAAGFTSTALSVGDQFSYGYPSPTPTQYIAVDYDTAGVDQISCVPAWGVDGATTFDLQPRGPADARGVFNQQTHMRPTPASMINTWVFYDEVVTDVEAYVHVVIEHQSNVFSHLNMGVLNKAGAWAGGGGAYTTGLAAQIAVGTLGSHTHPWHRPAAISSTVGQNWLAIDTTDIHATNTIESAEASGGTGGGALEFIKGEFPERRSKQSNVLSTAADYLTQDFLLYGVDWKNGLAPTFPIYCATKDSTAGVRYFLGEPNDVRFCSVEALPNGLNIITIGSDSWYFFPIVSSGEGIAFDLTGPSGTMLSSGIQGLAYKFVA